jgi:hypothetical protein
MKILKELSEKDKKEILLLFLIALFCTTLVILAIAWSRGRDVDYFKERVLIFEGRLDGMHKVIHDTRDKNDIVIERLKETNEKLDKVIDKQLDQDRWIEEWKKLPQLPKPKR